MKGRRFLVLITVLIFCLSVLVCARATNKMPLKIGAIFSVSGPAVWLGDPEKKTVQMLVEDINKAGGVNGYPLEVLIEDDETQPARAVNAVEKLIDKDNVLAVIGPSVSGSSLAVKPICEKDKVPDVSAAAAKKIVVPTAGSKYMFKVAALDSHVAIRILEQLKKMGISKIGIISSTSAFGDEGRLKLHKYAKQVGIEIVADETYAPTDTDMTAQLRKIASTGAGAVVNWSIEPAQSLVPKNMRQLGMKIPLFQSHGFGNPKYIQAAGEAAEGIIFPSGRLLVADALPANHWQKKILMKYKTEYEKKYGPPVSTFGAHAYDAIWLVVDAMKAKKITPNMNVAKARKLIRDGLEETHNWIGTSGHYNMSPMDHTGLDKDDSLEMLTVVKGGKIIPLSQKK